MNRVLVIGGGRIGSAFKSYLERDLNQYSVTVADPLCGDIKSNLFDDPSPIQGFNYCVNLAPVYDTVGVSRILTACIENHVHYFDVSEDVEVGAAVRRLGENQDSIIVVPHCGLAPGFINILAGNAMKEFSRIDFMDVRVGALPRAVANGYRYLSTWSLEGVVNEYAKDAPILWGGEHKTVNVFKNGFDVSFVNEVVIDGAEYECFPTSGGCSTLLDTVQEHSEKASAVYRSIRYRGHFDAMRELFRMGKNPSAIVDELRHLVPIGQVQDVVLVFVSITGMGNDGKTHTNTVVQVARSNSEHMAIQRTTAGSLAVVLDLHASGGLPLRGFLRQEMIPYQQFRGNRLFEVTGFE